MGIGLGLLTVLRSGRDDEEVTGTDSPQQKFLVHVNPCALATGCLSLRRIIMGLTFPPLNPFSVWLIHRQTSQQICTDCEYGHPVSGLLRSLYWNWTRLLTLVMVKAQVGALLTRPKEIRLGYQPSSTLKKPEYSTWIGSLFPI